MKTLIIAAAVSLADPAHGAEVLIQHEPADIATLPAFPASAQ